MVCDETTQNNVLNKVSTETIIQNFKDTNDIFIASTKTHPLAVRLYKNEERGIKNETELAGDVMWVSSKCSNLCAVIGVVAITCQNSEAA